MSNGHHHYADRPHPEFVVLDVGGRFGALIIHTDADLHGVEVEISPAARDDERSHKEFLERNAGGRPAYTAVFEKLEQGRYTLWTHGVPRARGVLITGGEVAELDWTRAAGAAIAAAAH
jgi:hypothetical protein